MYLFTCQISEDIVISPHKCTGHMICTRTIQHIRGQISNPHAVIISMLMMEFKAKMGMWQEIFLLLKQDHQFQKTTFKMEIGLSIWSVLLLTQLLSFSQFESHFLCLKESHPFNLLFDYPGQRQLHCIIQNYNIQGFLTDASSCMHLIPLVLQHSFCVDQIHNFQFFLISVGLCHVLWKSTCIYNQLKDVRKPLYSSCAYDSNITWRSPI